MVIDVHIHPVMFGAICEDQERVNFRRRSFGLYKASPIPMEHCFAVMDHAGVDRGVLLAEDYSASMGAPIVSNEEIRTLVDLAPDRFIGFASVDPRKGNAADSLRRAFEELGLSGLKLNLSHLNMYPDDRRLEPLYRLCEGLGKPIMFHTGFSWEPDSPSKYGRPILYEDVAVAFPKLRLCLAHLSWPWVDEMCMMILKYENVFTDTSTVFVDSPANYYDQIFKRNMGPLWLENNLVDKVMFGSNLPRFRQVRVLRGLESLGFRPDVMQKLLGGNAKVFLGLEEKAR
ncbi:MAG: amidohydrolase [Clostridiales bacterium]|nr:amidohydrolase [Clostridiales bacterium]